MYETWWDRLSRVYAYFTATYVACLEFVAIPVVGPARLLIAPDELVAKAAAQNREHQGYPADNGPLVIHRQHLRKMIQSSSGRVAPRLPMIGSSRR